MPKLNVYVPDALAEAVKRAELSVSAVCQKALEEEVRRVEARMQATSDVEKVAERLKATAGVEDKKKYELGLLIGRDWARNYATVSELDQIVALRPLWWVTTDLYEGHSLGTFLSEFDDDEALGPFGYDFRYLMNGGEIERDALSDGIVDGAAEIYDAVEPLL